MTTIDKEINNLAGYDLIISFGYRHILSKDILKTAKSNPINLHLSYLPFNKGAHPNFWSWVEDTPSGVTIHEIEQNGGLDTGRIIFQEKIKNADKNQTFAETYANLRIQLETLFMENFDQILNQNYISKPQLHRGTYHNSKQLPSWLENWDMKIIDAVKKYQAEL